MKSTLKIQNLKCGGCAHTIKTKLSEVDGIESVMVIIESGEVDLEYDFPESLVSAKQKLKSLGYPESDDVNSIVTKAKSFVSCATGKMSNHEK
jgi:copper chaperone CopZ